MATAEQDYAPEYLAWQAAQDRAKAAARSALEWAVMEAEMALEDARRALAEFEEGG